MHFSEFIRTNADRIIKEWEQFAHAITAAEGLPRWVLRDHALAIVNAVANEIEHPRPSSGERPSASDEASAGNIAHVAEVHVELRIESGFDLVQITGEYRALRACVPRLWRELDPEGFALGAAELVRFSELIDENLARAVPYYVERETQYRDRFLGILGHDLRNPLNAMSLAATALSRQGLNKQQLRAVSRILNGARRLSGMVNDLLDFARGRLGQPMTLTLTPADLGTVIDEVVDEVRVTFSNCVITFDGHGDLAGKWDCARMRQMVSNLLLNAILHGTGEQASITAGGDGAGVTLEFHNAGQPIAQELIGKIFDPLVQGQSWAKQGKGLGLGLFIVKEIVTAHSGTVSVTSSEADGTTFSVCLPRS
ncbi:MAG: sensor histidine kinase [Candidatus Binataceae bacterium]